MAIFRHWARVSRLFVWGSVICSVAALAAPQALASPQLPHGLSNNSEGLKRGNTEQSAVQALKYAKQEKWAEASAAASGLSDPLVNTLIDWYLFRSDYKRQDFMSLANFVNNYGDWPLASSVRLKAEEYFPAAYPDSYAFRWFNSYEPISYEGMLRYATALKNMGKTAELTKALAAWLPKAGIKPDEQRVILSRFGDALTKEILRDRFHSALLSRQYTNARAVARRLGGGYSALAEARIALAERYNGVDGLIARVPESLQNDAGLLLERVQWRRHADNYDGAIGLMAQLPQEVTHQDTLDFMWRERHILIRHLMEKKRFKEAFTLAESHQQTEGFPHAQAQWMAGWLALRYVNKPMEAFHRFNALYQNVETPISRSRGAYWAGRASEALGDKKAADAWYAAAAQYPTVFYGQLALDKLNQPANYRGRPETAPTGRDFKAFPKVRAAKLLHAAGLQNDAEMFVRNLIDDAEDGRIRFADLSALAKQLDAPHLAIHIAKKAETKGHLLLDDAFPRLPADARRLSGGHMALIHGLIRQESGFYPSARSRSGALGLMQLMPATARETAGKMGLRYSKAALTNDPTFNIKLGTRYIIQMLERFDGSYPLAIAAYNGGPGRVGRWVGELGDPRGLDHNAMLDWIEMIPVYETRNYVQRVTEAMRVYNDIFYRAGYDDTLQTAWNQKNQR